MAVDLANFLSALAGYLATAAALQFTGTPRDLWIYQSDEATPGACAKIFSVLRLYDGSAPWTPVTACSVQIETLAPKGQDKAGLTRAQTLFNAMLDSTGRPVRMVTIAPPGTVSSGLWGWRINAADLRVPGLVRRDENGRGVWVMNVELRVVAIPPTG